MKEERNNATPLKAVRKRCLECMDGSSTEVNLCPSKKCSLYLLRFGRKEGSTSVLSRIRKKCLDCSENINTVRTCPFEDCPLHTYRFGHNPSRKGIGNPNGVIIRKKRQ